MHSLPLTGRLGRAATWPQDKNSHKGVPMPAANNVDDIPERFPSSSSSTEYHQTRDRTYASNTFTENIDDDDIDENPERHFLSPVHMYEYEDWASDSDDSESEEVEWDAGITDFALYDDDRRQAQASGTSLPGRWNDLLSNQASALQRSVDRSRSQQATATGNRRSFAPPLPYRESDDVPELIPDNSPELRDDLDAVDHDGVGNPRTSLPRITVTPPEGNKPRQPRLSHFNNDSDDEVDDDDDEGLFFSLRPDRQGKKRVRFANPRPSGRVSRPPGLSQTSQRTLSGRAHVWRWPSIYIPPVSEDSEGEVVAEREDLDEEGEGFDEDRLGFGLLRG